MQEIKKTWLKSNCKICKTEFLHRRSIKKTYCSRKCSNSDPETKSKIILSQNKTFDKKYGCHPMKLGTTQDNLKKSVLKLYGVENYSKFKTFKEQRENTLIKKYGIPNYRNIDKYKKTCLDKYNVDNYSKSSEYKKLHEDKNIIKFENSSVEYKKTMLLSFLKNEKFNNLINNVNLEDIDKKHQFKCIKCSSISEFFINDGVYPKCKICDNFFSLVLPK